MTTDFNIGDIVVFEPDGDNQYYTGKTAKIVDKGPGYISILFLDESVGNIWVKLLSAEINFHTGNFSPGALGKLIGSLLPVENSLIPRHPRVSK